MSGPKHLAAIESVEFADEISLERSLRPLWKLTYYTGILSDWCHKIPIQSRISHIAHRICYGFCLLLLLFGFMFEFIQLIIEMSKEDSSIQSVISNLLWFCNFPIAIMTALAFHFRRSQLLALFEDWNHFEVSVNLPKNHYKRMIKFVYLSYSCTALCAVCSVTVLMFNRPDASYLLSHYQILKESITFPGVVTFHLVSLFFMYVFLVLCELVPAWTFYHAGLALQSFVKEIEQSININNHNKKRVDDGITKSACEIRNIQLRYEVLSRLIDKANKLFGPWMVFEKAWSFFLISALLYIFLSKINKEPEFATLAYAVGMVIFSFRLVTCTLMAAHVYKCARRLRVVLSIALSREVMNPEETNRAAQFLRRMRENPLAARPLNLYDITPSLLFTFYSFAISYVFILLRIQ